MNTLSTQSRGDQVRDGFTLVEVLVAMAIFLTMMAFLSGILSTVSNITGIGQQNSRNANNARAIFDLIRRELQSGVNRVDLPGWIVADPSTATLTFYSCSPGSAVSGANATGYRNLSFIKYQLDATVSTLRRGDSAAFWSSDPDILPLGVLSPNTPNPILNDILTGVLAFHVTFLRQDGTFSNTYKGLSTNPEVAMGVSLAVIDARSLKTIKGENLQTLSQTLNQIAQGSLSPKAAWENAIRGINAENPLMGYPVGIRSRLQFFERFIDMPQRSRVQNTSIVL